MPVIYISPFSLLHFYFYFIIQKWFSYFSGFKNVHLWWMWMCCTSVNYAKWIALFAPEWNSQHEHTYEYFILFPFFFCFSFYFLCRRKVKEHFAINWWMGVHYVGWANVSEVYDEKFLSILKQFLLFQLLDGYGCTHLQMSAFLFIMFLFWNIFLLVFCLFFLANK